MTTETRKTPHEFLNASGEVVESIDSAAGIRYHTTTGEVVDFIPSPEQLRLLAVFGARTLATNTISSFYGAKDSATGQRPRKDDAPDTDAIGLRDRFAAITSDSWGAERGGGTGGIGYNLDDLCAALGEVVTAAGKPFNAERVAEALRDGGTLRGQALDARAYRKAVFGMAGVADAYRAIRAAKAGPAPTVEDTADDFA